jgi:hypothetical protein
MAQTVPECNILVERSNNPPRPTGGDFSFPAKHDEIPIGKEKARSEIARRYRLESHSIFYLIANFVDPSMGAAPIVVPRRMDRKNTMNKQKILFIVAVISGAVSFLPNVASAGQCPADKISADATKPNAAPAKGVSDTVLAAIDHAQEPAQIANRMLRLSMASAFTLTLAYLGEQCSASETAGAFAAYITGNVASNLFGRLMAAAVSDHFGLVTNFYVFAGLSLAGAFLVYFTIGQAPPMPAATRSQLAA